MSWSSKKQNLVAVSPTEVEYVLVGCCCAQFLWMKAILLDYRIKFYQVTMLCDDESANNIATNMAPHSRTKHIDIYHHFIRDYQGEGDITVESVSISDQLANIFTKPHYKARFYKLMNELVGVSYLAPTSKFIMCVLGSRGFAWRS